MKMWEKVKELMFGYPDSEYDDYDSDMEYEEDLEQKNDTILEPHFFGSKKVVSINNDINSSSNNFKVVLYNPTSFKEGTSIVDSLRSGKLVIVDLKDMKDKKEDAGAGSDFESQKEMFDFLNGAMYAIDGSMKKLSSTIFVIAPKSVDIDSNLESELSRRESRGLWAQSAL